MSNRWQFFGGRSEAQAAVEKRLSDAGVRTQLLNVVVSGGVLHV
jgi:hypothetical protein